MSIYLNRKSLICGLSTIRLDETQALLAARKYHGAYYLAGYAVECALKAKIAGNVKKHDFPDKALASEVYTHELTRLIKSAGLDVGFQRDRTSNRNLDINWAVVKGWSEEKRYDASIKARDARDLLQSITDPSDGIMQWIEHH